MTNLESLVVSISLKADALMTGLHKTEEALKEMGEAAEHAQEKLKEMSEKGAPVVEALHEHITGLLGALASVGAFMMFTEHTVKAQVATQRLAAEAKMDVVELGALQIAAGKLGGSAEGVNRSITMMGEKLSMLGTKMRRAKLAGMALGMAMGFQGKEAEAAGVKMFKGKKPLEAMMMMADKMKEKGDFFSAKKLGAMAGISDESLIRNMMKGKEAFAKFIEEQKKYAATSEDVEHSLAFEEAQKDAKFAIEKVAMTIMQYLLPALKWLSETLVEVADWFREHPAVIKNVLITLGVLMTILGAHAARMGVQMVTAWAASGAHAVLAALKMAWAGVVWMATAIKMHAAWLIALGPIGLIIAAIEIVIAACVGLYMKFEKFRNVAKGVFAFVADYIKMKVDGFIDMFSLWWEHIKAVFGFIVSLFSGDGNKISEAWKKVTDSLEDMWDEAWWSMRDDLILASIAILSVFDNMWEKIKNKPAFRALVSASTMGLSEIAATAITKSDAMKGAHAGAAAAADAVRPSMVSTSSASHKSAHASVHIDNLEIVAPAAHDAAGVAGEIHGELKKAIAHAEHL